VNKRTYLIPLWAAVNPSRVVRMALRHFYRRWWIPGERKVMLQESRDYFADCEWEMTHGTD